METKGLETAEILRTKLSVTSRRKVTEFVESRLANDLKFYIVTPNPEIVVAVQKDSDLQKAINNADLSVADGVGLVLAAKFLGKKGIHWIRGRELMLDLFALANKKHLKIFLLGSTEAVIKRCLEKISSQYPRIKARGFMGPNLSTSAKPVTEVDSILQKDALDKINKFVPDLLFVAFGVPKQEKWIFQNLPMLKIGGAMVVGGSLDYFSGKQPLPPFFIASSGLEWLWRLVTKRGHLKRVFRATFLFPLLLIKDRLRWKKII